MILGNNTKPVFSQLFVCDRDEEGDFIVSTLGHKEGDFIITSLFDSYYRVV